MFARGGSPSASAANAGVGAAGESGLVPRRQNTDALDKTHKMWLTPEDINEAVKDMTMHRQSGMRVMRFARDIFTSIGAPDDKQLTIMQEVAAVLIEEVGFKDPDDLDQWTVSHLAIFCGNIIWISSRYEKCPIEESTMFRLFADTLASYVPLQSRRDVSEAALRPAVTPAPRPAGSRQQRSVNFSMPPPTVMAEDADDFAAELDEEWGAEAAAAASAASQHRDPSSILSAQTALDPAQWSSILGSQADVTRLVEFWRSYFALSLRSTTVHRVHVSQDMIRILEAIALTTLSLRSFPAPLQQGARTAIKRLIMNERLSEGHGVRFVAEFGDAVEEEGLPQWIASATKTAAQRAKLLQDLGDKPGATPKPKPTRGPRQTPKKPSPK